MAETPERKALYSYSRDYRTDPEGLERMRESLSSIPNWHDRAPINCNSLARLLDTIEALSRPMEAVAWRLKRVDVERWNLWDLDPRVDTPAYADASKWTVQALAVIPTPEDGRTDREAAGSELIGFDPVSTTRSHRPARLKGPIARADFGPAGEEGDARFEAFLQAQATEGEGQ